MVIGLGENAARRAVAERFPQTEWMSVVYRSAYVNTSARIGRGSGSVVFPGAVVGADAVLGAHVIVSSTVGHDVTLADFSHVAPGVQVAGAAVVEEGAMLTIGSVGCPGVRIGAWATLAAGAVAVQDVPAGCLALGVPARPRGTTSTAPSSRRRTPPDSP